MDSDDEVSEKNEDECRVEEGPQILRIHFPAMLEDGCNLVKDLREDLAPFASLSFIDVDHRAEILRCWGHTQPEP
jgi:hypothetical protein